MDRASLRWDGRFAFLLGATALVVLVGLLGIWGIFANIAGAVVAPGLVKVESDRQVVQHSDGGVVGAIYVRDGDYVTAGQPVLKFDDADVRSELSIIENQLAETVARIGRLRAERDGTDILKFDLTGIGHLDTEDIFDGQRHLFEARKLSFMQELGQVDEQIKKAQDQIIGVDAQITAIDIQIDLFSKELENKKQLYDRGLLVLARYLELQRKLAQMQGERGRLVALRGQHESTIAGFEISKLRLTTARREKAITKLRDLEGERLKFLENMRVANRKLSRLEVTAPVSGIVFDSKVFTLQSVVLKGTDIMYIVPQDQPLVILAKIPAPDIDQVVVGQDVSLRFTALDLTLTPEIDGKLRKVSADSVIDDKTGAAFYEAEIIPVESQLAKLGDQKLVPGMPVEAYIRTSSRSPLGYLTRPFINYFNRAFRES